MAHKAPRLKPFLEVGYKVQLSPSEEGSFTYAALKERALTVTRIEEHPDPAFLGIETQEDWESHLRIRWFSFWVKVDDCTDLPEFFKEQEIVFREGSLQPIPPRLPKQHLVQFCQQRLRDERDEQRREAYLLVLRHLLGQPLNDPWLSLAVHIPAGQQIDLINQCIQWAARLRDVARQMGGTTLANPFATRCEAQAQVLAELIHKLLPKERVVASPL